MVYAYATIVFATLFLAILILLHFLKPDLNPAWRMITEYEIGRFGWMMRLAFFCWGLTVLVWLGMVSFFASIIISRLINPSTKRVEPDVYLGWPNRLMVSMYFI